jgi:Tol biopolymer transport system component
MDQEALASVPTVHHPVVSPAGERVAFVSDETGRFELYCLDADSGTCRQITDGDLSRDGALPVRWLPDGGRLLYLAGEEGDVWSADVYELALGGTSTLVCETGAQTQLQCVGPDGRYVYYTDRDDETRRLCRFDRRSDRHEILYTTTGAGTSLTATVRPDGDRPAYGESLSDLFVARSDGTNARALAIGDDESWTHLHGWHPGGTRLLVSCDVSGTMTPGLYDLDSDGITWYGSEEYVGRGVRVAPDGDRILILSVTSN